MLCCPLAVQGQFAEFSSQSGPQKTHKDPGFRITSYTILACHVKASDLLHGLCSLALADGEDKLHFYSLSEHVSVRHIHTTTLPMENTSAGLAVKFRWTVCTSKLGKRCAAWPGSTSPEQALLCFSASSHDCKARAVLPALLNGLQNMLLHSIVHHLSLICRGLRRLDWLMLQRATAPGSMICLPILASQRVLGVLTIAAQSPTSACR